MPYIQGFVNFFSTNRFITMVGNLRPLISRPRIERDFFGTMPQNPESKITAAQAIHWAGDNLYVLVNDNPFQNEADESRRQTRDEIAGVTSAIAELTQIPDILQNTNLRKTYIELYTARIKMIFRNRLIRLVVSARKDDKKLDTNSLHTVSAKIIIQLNSIITSLNEMAIGDLDCFNNINSLPRSDKKPNKKYH